jgi:hypothetical protein
MNTLLLRGTAIAIVMGLLAILSYGCAVSGGGYGYDGGGLDYYEPYGVDYGGWGPGYRVAPFRDGGQRSGGGGHAYRAAPASHAMPSIPSGSRSGGGGGRGGGGRR